MTRVALVQMRSEKGAIQQNLASILQILEDATRHGVEIIGFPEMSLTGYSDPTKYPNAVLDSDGPEVTHLLKATRPYSATVLVGLIERNPVGKPFITQLVLRKGQLLGIYRKITIKDEEVEWFSPGEDVPVFQLDGLTFGIAICADIDNQQVFAVSKQQGAETVFELAAPGLYGEQATRNWASGYAWWEGACKKNLGRYAQTLGLWIAVATQAGRTVDEDFPGGGYVFSPNGERLYATRDWSPGTVYLDIDFDQNTITELAKK